MMINEIDDILCWLKVAENFDKEEVEKLKELITQIFDTLFEINGTEEDDCCEKCGQEIWKYETPEYYELSVKKDIPKDALCHTCTYICIFHEERHYKCSDYHKKEDSNNG